MTRTLARVDASDPLAVSNALRDALTADGPAVFPVAAGGTAPVGVLPKGSPPKGSPPDDLPESVAQRIALVVETSGSSGRPKRVALTADAVLASAAASDTALGGPGQWLLALPAHYIAGINVLARSITAQTVPVILPAGHFDADAFVDAARGLDGDRRYASLVPVQLARLVEAAETDAAARDILRRFDRLLIGGQATTPQLIERAAALGLRVTRTYGSSETCGGCVYDGTPIGTTSVRVVDGEVELGGPVLADGYLGDHERTSDAFITDDAMRWYRTGDTGEFIDGVLSVTGRRDRVIISGGEKVSLDAVERVLREVPGYVDAVAVGADDPEWGQSVVLVIAASDAGAPPPVSSLPLVPPPAAVPDAVADALVAALGRAARPRRAVVVRDIPFLAGGKPDRVRIAALL